MKSVYLLIFEYKFLLPYLMFKDHLLHMFSTFSILCVIFLVFVFFLCKLIIVLCSNTKCKPLHSSDLPYNILVLKITFSVTYFSRVHDI